MTFKRHIYLFLALIMMVYAFPVNAGASYEDDNNYLSYMESDFQCLEPDDQCLEPDDQYLEPDDQWLELDAQWLESDVQCLEPDDQCMEPDALYAASEVQNIENDDQNATTDTQYMSLDIQSMAVGIHRYTVVVLDRSGSMYGAPLAAMKRSAVLFCEQVLRAEGDNYVAVVTYDTSVATVSDFSSDINWLSQRINNISLGGSTSMNAGLVSADSMLAEVPEGPDIVKNILLLSDGLPNMGPSISSGKYSTSDYSSYAYANAVYNTACALHEKGYNLYTLGFFHSLLGDTLSFARRFMDDLQNAGYYDVVNPDDLEFVFGEIADDIISESGHIIVIPGILGSELENTDDNNVIWLKKTSSSVKDLKILSMDDKGNPLYSNVQAKKDGYGTVQVVNGTYKEMIQKLEKEYGENKVHYFAYDWRMDNRYNAVKLEEYINKDLKKAGKVTLVAHSMGGLIVSQYIANGNANKIDKLITIGTPYYGSPKVPYVFATGKMLPLGLADKALKALAPYMATAYQLLPYKNIYHYMATNTVKSGLFGDKLSYDYVLDEHGYIKNNLPMKDINEQTVSPGVKASFLKNAVDFMDGIYKSDFSIHDVDSYVIVGKEQSTIHTTLFDSNGGYVKDFEYKSGDGTVPLWSATMHDSIDEDRLFSYKDSHTGLVSNQKVIKKIIELINNKTVDNDSDPADNNRRIVIRVACPVDVTVSHPLYGSLSSSDIESDVEWGTVYLAGEDDEIKIFAIDDGSDEYEIYIEGNGYGEMDLTIRYFDADYNFLYENYLNNVSVTTNTKAFASTDPENAVLLIDENGDGEYEVVSLNLHVNEDAQFAITANATAGGSTIGSGVYKYGETVVIKAIPDQAYVFAGWFENDIIIEGAGAEYMMIVTAERDIQARFNHDAVKETDVAHKESGVVNKKSVGSNTSFSTKVKDNQNNDSVAVNAQPQPEINDDAAQASHSAQGDAGQATLSPRSDAAADYARELYKLGLFLGTGKDPGGEPIFDLDQPVDRIQALTLVIRLLGEEKSAMAYGGPNPFIDVPGWGTIYAAYGYATGLTVGVDFEHTLFAADRLITLQEFSAFVLRTLGYYEKNGDFNYENAIDKAMEVGLYTKDDLDELTGEKFLRGNAVTIMIKALQVNVNGADGVTLIEKLAKNGVFSLDDANAFLDNVRTIG